MGLFLMPSHPPERSVYDSHQWDLDYLQLADELGYHAEKNIVHVRDLHATMLHQLGIDHERFSVKHQGLDMRLSGVEKARVVKDILI